MRFKTPMLWFVKQIIEIMNSDNMLCGSFGMYPCYIAGILNRMPNIHFYVVCSEKINFDDYIRKYMANKECTISNFGDTFCIYFQERVIKVSFEQRVASGKLLSELTFAYNILKKISLSCLAHGMHHPFTLIVARPSSSGKSTFVIRLLESRDRLCDIV
jgi:hypothetical protein